MCCHSIIKTLLLHLLDSAKWLKNDMNKYITTWKGSNFGKCSHSGEKSGLGQKTWNILNRYHVFLSLKQPWEEHLHKQKTLFKLWFAEICLGCCDFFVPRLWNLVSSALVGVNCICWLYQLSWPMYTYENMRAMNLN